MITKHSDVVKNNRNELSDVVKNYRSELGGIY